MEDNQPTTVYDFILSLSTNVDVLSNLEQTYRSMFYEPMEPISPISQNPIIPVTRTCVEKPPIPVSRIANKARIYPPIANGGSVKMTIPPQNINDALKPSGETFKYFEKPMIPTKRGDYTELIKEFMIHDTSYANNMYDKITLNEFKEEFENKGLSIVPPEVYTYSWHSFNKQFILNRCKNFGMSIPVPSTVVDPYIMQTLKQLYPNVNENILRRDYDKLIYKHALVDSKGFSVLPERRPLFDLMITENPIIARLDSMLSSSTSIHSLYTTIHRATETIPDKFVIAKVPRINKRIIEHDMLICKLAFICGSTDETIINDIESIRQYIKLLKFPLPQQP